MQPYWKLNQQKTIDEFLSEIQTKSGLIELLLADLELLFFEDGLTLYSKLRALAHYLHQLTLPELVDFLCLFQPNGKHYPWIGWQIYYGADYIPWQPDLSLVL